MYVIVSMSYYLGAYYCVFLQHEREVEKEAIQEAQTKTPKNEGPFQFVTPLDIFLHSPHITSAE